MKMGIFYYFPSFNISYIKDYIKDYFIIMYFDLISSQFYLHNKELFRYYLGLITLMYSSGKITYVNERCFYVPFKTHSGTYKIPLIFTNDSNILKAVNEDGRDLSCFLGPSKNFFGIKLKPRDIGCKKVTITLQDNTDKSFNEDETIVF